MNWINQTTNPNKSNFEERRNHALPKMKTEPSIHGWVSMHTLFSEEADINFDT